ncbi:hypothetical protein N9166_01100 [bacterium]|nr:hypothetical protein [bacterium]
MMRKISVLLVASALLLTVPGVANAGLLYWDGTMTMKFGGLITLARTGTGVATVNGSSGLGHLTTLRLAGGITAKDQVVPVTDPAVPEVERLTGDLELGTGTLKPISGTTNGPGPLTQNEMSLPGNFKICMLIAGCSAWLEFPIKTPGSTVGVGIGGVSTSNGFGAGFRISMEYAPWTIRTAVITGVYTENAMIPNPNRVSATSNNVGFAHGPVSGSSTANTGGVVQVVTPALITTSLMPPNNFIGAPFTLKLRFVPEPGLLLLLASGVGGLALLGRRRLHR